MIWIRLFGGLGNQLFQYATARALSLSLGTTLALDRRYLGSPDTHFAYALNHFAIVADVDPPRLPPHRSSNPMAHALWRMGIWPGPRFLREHGLGLNQSVLSARDGTYLHGYFQSARYFDDHLATLQQDLRIITPPSTENAEWLDRIAADEGSVSVHLRRGDYVSAPKGGATHGTCDEFYYRRALAQIAARTGIAPTAYVFSDDPAWAREHLSLGPETVVIGHNGPLQHYEDLRLMSACRHHVIANSTFSWWGAWLDHRPTATVVAPARWFASDGLANPDILPDGWLRA